ncbi:MAG TPA: signal peptidase I [Verrucomicrobiae bacterium]|nr:signal peptidase I [Verrucomicrobiae bacterium]
MDAEEPSPAARSPNWLRFIYGRNPALTLVRILSLIFISIVVFKFVLLPIRVTGQSMFPTYRNGQIRFVNRLNYLWKAPQRGDIVAVEFQGKEVLLLKRIVGLPGEHFHVFNGELYINGQKLVEPYANGKVLSPNNKGLGSTREVINLGPTEYMVIGDNRPVSEGYIKDGKQIVGKVL